MGRMIFSLVQGTQQRLDFLLPCKMLLLPSEADGSDRLRCTLKHSGPTRGMKLKLRREEMEQESF